MTREDHPHNWYYPVKQMRTLILGTFPPHKGKRHFEFYYPNKQNRFWKALAKVAGRSILEEVGTPAVAERKLLMEHLRVGLQNIGKVIERKGKSSLDRDIVISEFHDILGIVDAHSTLKVILLTGYSGPSSTYHSFIRYLTQNRVEHTLPAKVEAGQSFTVTRNGPIKCILGNSTSRAARRVRFEDLVEQFKRAVIDEHREI